MGENPLLVDVKGIYAREDLAGEGVRVWRL
jgi:hypothetical protein